MKTQTLFLRLATLFTFMVALLHASSATAGGWKFDHFEYSSDAHSETQGDYAGTIQPRHFVARDATAGGHPRTPYIAGQDAAVTYINGWGPAPGAPRRNYAHSEFSVTPIFHWYSDRDLSPVHEGEDDAPPNVLYIREAGDVVVGRGLVNNNFNLMTAVFDTYNGDDFALGPIQNSMAATEAERTPVHTATHGPYGVGVADTIAILHITPIPTGGQRTVSGPTRTFNASVTAKAPFETPENGENGRVYIRSGSVAISYGLEILGHSLSVTPIGLGRITKNLLDDKEMDAWAKIAFDAVGDPEDPVRPLWFGQADLTLSSTRIQVPNSLNPFDNPFYKWTVTPDPYLPILDPPRQFPPNYNDLVGTVFGPIAGIVFAPTESAEEPYDARLRTLLPAPSTATKSFHWDFGSDPAYANFPVTTKASVYLTDKDAATNAPKPNAPLMRAKVAINWHTVWEGTAGGDTPFIAFPAGVFVHMADNTVSTDDDVATTKAIENVVVGDVLFRDGVPTDEALWKWNVTKVEILADGSRKLSLALHFDPDDECGHANGVGCQIDDQIKKIEVAYKQAIKEGAKGVELGLTVYKEIATFYAQGPFFELGGEILVSAGTKAAELLQTAIEARSVSSRCREAAGVCEALALRLRGLLAQGGRAPEEVAQLERQVAELEENSVKLRKGAEDLDNAATECSSLAERTSSEIQISGGGPNVPEVGAGIPAGAPGSAEHRAQAWAAYQERGGQYSYQRWSNVYLGNMTRATNANAAAVAYGNTLGWGEKEVTVWIGGFERRLDWADLNTKRGMEFKTGYVVAREEIRWEIARDRMLVEDGWAMDWVVRGKVSRRLRHLLAEANISLKIVE